MEGERKKKKERARQKREEKRSEEKKRNPERTGIYSRRRGGMTRAEFIQDDKMEGQGERERDDE